MAKMDNDDWYSQQNSDLPPPGMAGGGQGGMNKPLIIGVVVAVLACICLVVAGVGVAAFVFFNSDGTVSGGGGGVVVAPNIDFSAIDGYQTTLERNISVGSNDSATLDSLSEAHNWIFTGTAGQQVTIRVNGRGDTDPRAKLIDSNGNIIAEDDDGGGGLNSLITATLPSDGTYIVRIDVFTGGTYNINIR